MVKYKKYLVTGGYGFIGSCLLRNLIGQKDVSIVNIDKVTYAANNLALENKTKGHKHYKKDINDSKFLNKLFKEYEPDCIFHLAAESHVDRSIDNPSDFINTNIVGTYNLLNEAYNYWKSLNLRKNDNFRFIHISTDEVYGDAKKDTSFSEFSPFLPNSPYAASKASADLLVRSWCQTFGFPAIITNSSNNYGKWQFPEKLIPLTIKKALLKQDIPVYGDGKQVRDWIYVEDHIEGLLSVLNRGKIGDKYNIASSKEITNLEVVKTICSILDELEPSPELGKYNNLITFVEDRPGHDKRYSMNISKITKELNWSPKVSFVEGIRETIIWYLNNKDWLFNDHQLSYDGRRLGNLD